MNKIFKQRRENYLDLIPNFSLSLFFSGKEITSTNDLYFPFVTNKNFYYLTGITQSNSILLFVKGQCDSKTFLFTETISAARALWIGEKLTSDEATKISGIEKIFSIDEFEHVFSTIMNTTKVESMFLDLHKRNMESTLKIEEHFAEKYRFNYPHLLVKNSFPYLANMRIRKDENEVNDIKKAIQITHEAILNMMNNAKSGMYEYQLLSYFLQTLKYHNVNEAFNSIVASGKWGTILHYEKNDNQILDNTLVLCDVGCSYNNYASDVTRTFPINGKFTERQKTIYEIVLEANKKAISYLKPGVLLNEFENYGRHILIEGLKREKIIADDKEIEKYYYHSLGHFLGLDVHDIGDTSFPLKPGMVITVEPGLYISEENIGIRIEDDVLITEDGSINLSVDIPKEIHEIENIMKH